MSHANVDTVFEADDSPLREALDRSQEGFEKFKNKIAAVSVIAETAFGYVTNAAANHIVQMKRLSDEYDINIETIQAFAHGVEKMGGSFEGAVSSLQRFERMMGQAEMGTGRAAHAIKSLGLRMEELQTKDTEEQLVAVIDAIEKIPDPARRAREAMMMGMGPDVVMAFRQGGEALKEYKEELEKKGAGISLIDAAEVLKAKQAITEMHASLEVLAAKITIAVAPTVKKMAEYIEGLVNAFNKHQDIISFVGKLFTVVGPVAMIAFGIQKLRGMMGMLTEATGLSSIKALLFGETVTATKSAVDVETASIERNTMAKQQNAAASSAAASADAGMAGMGGGSGTYGLKGMTAAEANAAWQAEKASGLGARGASMIGESNIVQMIAGGYLGNKIGGLFGEQGAQYGTMIGGIAAPHIAGGLGSMMSSGAGSLGMAAGGSAAAVGGAALAAGAGLYMGGRAIYRASTGADVKEYADEQQKHDNERAQKVQEARAIGQQQAAAFGARQRESAFGAFAHGKTGDSEAAYAEQKKAKEAADKAMDEARNKLNEHKRAAGESTVYHVPVGSMWSYWAGDSEKDKLEKEYDEKRIKFNKEMDKLSAIPRDHKQSLADSMGEYWKGAGISDEEEVTKGLRDALTEAFKGNPLRAAETQHNVGQQAKLALNDPEQRAKLEEQFFGKGSNKHLSDADLERVRLSSQEKEYQAMGLSMSPGDESSKGKLAVTTQAAFFERKRKEANAKAHEEEMRGNYGTAHDTAHAQNIAGINAEEQRAKFKVLSDMFGTDLTPSADKYTTQMKEANTWLQEGRINAEQHARIAEGLYRTYTKVTTAAQKMLDFQREMAQIDAAAKKEHWTPEQIAEAKGKKGQEMLGLGEFKSPTQIMNEKLAAIQAGTMSPEARRKQIEQAAGLGETRGHGSVQAEGFSKIEAGLNAMRTAGLTVNDAALRKEIEKLAEISDTRSVQEKIAQNTADINSGIEKLIASGLNVSDDAKRDIIGKKFGVNIRNDEDVRAEKEASYLGAMRTAQKQNVSVDPGVAMRQLQQTLSISTQSGLTANRDFKTHLESIAEATHLGYFGPAGDEHQIRVLREMRGAQEALGKDIGITQAGWEASRGGNVGQLQERLHELSVMSAKQMDAFTKQKGGGIGILGIGAEVKEAMDKFAPEVHRNVQVESATGVYDRIQKAAASRSSSDPALAVQYRIHEAIEKQRKEMKEQVEWARVSGMALKMITEGKANLGFARVQ